MAKDLTTSQIDRQNILNNELAINEIKETINLKSVFWNEKYYLTKEMVATYFEVDIRTIERYISNHNDELSNNGFEILKGKRLHDFIETYNQEFATDINVGRKFRALSVFDFRSFLNLAKKPSALPTQRAFHLNMLPTY